MKARTLFLTTVCLWLAGLNIGHGQTTAQTYQGYLKNGGTAASGAHDIVFHLFAFPSGGVPSAVSTNLNVAVQDGLFVTTLDFGQELFDGTEYWLQLSVRPSGGGPFTILEPRQALTAQAYALYASHAGALADGSITNPGFLGTTTGTELALSVRGQTALRLEPDPTPALGSADSFNLIGGYAGNFAAEGVRGATIGGGGSADTFSLPVFELPNMILADFATISGGLGNAAGGFAGTVGGGILNSNDGDQSTLGGGDSNTIEPNAAWSTIGGGEANAIQATANRATIAGGAMNQVHFAAVRSTIGGGAGNVIGTNANSGFIGGGNLNRIEKNAFAAAIVGGQNNTNGADRSFIGGGTGNGISSIANGSIIVGGSRNLIELGAEHATIGGGSDNRVGGSADYATIAGGNDNAIDTDTFDATISGGNNNQINRSANNATIGGGLGNVMLENAFAAVIGGGGRNTNSGNFATVPGGRENLADAAASFAAGTRAKAIHDGAFVWGDSTDDDVLSTAPNQVTLRASGGMRVFSNTNLTQGVLLNPGSSSWSMGSDRNIKENFSAVNTRQILEQLTSIPIQAWNYQAQSDQVRHIGPMAQDFHAAFGMGEDERHISSVDADGVAFAAIQGLHAMLKERDQEIESLRQTVEELKALVRAMQQP